jgi:hypothetical protein
MGIFWKPLLILHPQKVRGYVVRLIRDRCEPMSGKYS